MLKGTLDSSTTAAGAACAAGRDRECPPLGRKGGGPSGSLQYKGSCI